MEVRPRPKRRKFGEGSKQALGGRPGEMEDAHTEPVVLTFAVLREHFDLPLHEVATKLGVCTTSIKKVCRKMGIKTWPHREMKAKRQLHLALLSREAADGCVVQQWPSETHELPSLKKHESPWNGIDHGSIVADASQVANAEGGPASVSARKSTKSRAKFTLPMTNGSGATRNVGREGCFPSSVAAQPCPVTTDLADIDPFDHLHQPLHKIPRCSLGRKQAVLSAKENAILTKDTNSEHANHGVVWNGAFQFDQRWPNTYNELDFSEDSRFGGSDHADQFERADELGGPTVNFSHSYFSHDDAPHYSKAKIVGSVCMAQDCSAEQVRDYGADACLEELRQELAPDDAQLERYSLYGEQKCNTGLCLGQQAKLLQVFGAVFAFAGVAAAEVAASNGRAKGYLCVCDRAAVLVANSLRFRQLLGRHGIAGEKEDGEVDSNLREFGALALATDLD